MNKKSLALVLNFIFFGGIFILIKNTIGTHMPMSYVPLIAFSGILTSVISPKFMVHDQSLFLKLPLKKTPIRLY